tara:strand:+ start:44 stop:739 length:696 start_codon:yes stop_codon:yes gene_type:complete
MKKILLLFGCLFLIINSCSEEDPPPVNPGIATLISPINQETCFDGVSINDTQSNVEFSWSAASDAISYEILVSNLLTQSTQTYTANTNKTTVALTKAEPYSWYVKSIGENGSTPSQSDSWRFYLAGESIINYAPFPSELISPRSGANVTPDINNQIILNWSCSDVDGDLQEFEVYLDENDGSTLNTSIKYEQQDSNLEVEVANNSTYFWKVIAIDANGNKSNSGVYTFRTN